MTNLPKTIEYPDTFIRTVPPGFDGVFDWSWTQGCFGKTKIKPMDIDSIVERKGNFIIFETKGVGVPVPQGQMLTLDAMYKRGFATVVFIQGKTVPSAAMVWCAKGFKGGKKMSGFKFTDRLRMHNFVKDWFQFADKITQMGNQ